MTALNAGHPLQRRRATEDGRRAREAGWRGLSELRSGAQRQKRASSADKPFLRATQGSLLPAGQKTANAGSPDRRCHSFGEAKERHPAAGTDSRPIHGRRAECRREHIGVSSEGRMAIHRIPLPPSRGLFFAANSERQTPSRQGNVMFKKIPIAHRDNPSRSDTAAKPDRKTDAARAGDLSAEGKHV